MEQWKKLLGSLSRRQQISLIGVAVLVIATLAGFSYWRKERDFRPLFTGMAAEDAGAIVDKLKESGAEYRVSDNGSTVLVRSERVAETRLQMAASGLPKTGRIGFELFDKTNLGATDFTEQVNYRRALEGELERSIKSVMEVEQARVHLTFPKDSVFLESRLPAKASVLIKVKPGVKLTPSNVTAVAHLVASAVEGLAPEAVSILDVHGNLLSRPNRTQEIDGASDELIEYRQQVERDLLAKINATLEPLLGDGRFRAGVSVECDFTSGEQSEETYDPERSVMLTSQKSEESAMGSTAAGVPGTAANLPRPPARAAGSGPGISKRTESITYQSSKTVRRVKLPQGGIKRLSASILLDQTVKWEKKGNNLEKTFVPPSAESLRAIKEIVSASIGFVPSRGDQLVVESLPFETTLNTPPPESAVPQSAPPATGLPNWLQQVGLDPRLIAGIAGGLILLVGVAGYLLRKRRKRKKTVTTTPALPRGSQSHEIGTSEGAAQLAAVAGLPAQIEALGVAQTARIEQLLGVVRTHIHDDPALAANVLRTWMEEKRS